MEGNELVIVIIIQAVLFLSLIVVYLTRVKRVGPNEALIISGRAGREAWISDEGYPFRVVIGGRGFVWPLLEKAQVMSLEPFGESFTFTRLKTADSRQMTISGKVQFHINKNLNSARKAASYFLSKNEEEKTQIVMALFESELRRLVENTPGEEIEAGPMKFADKLVETADEEMLKMGIKTLSLIIDDVHF